MNHLDLLYILWEDDGISSSIDYELWKTRLPDRLFRSELLLGRLLILDKDEQWELEEQ